MLAFTAQGECASLHATFSRVSDSPQEPDDMGSVVTAPKPFALGDDVEPTGRAAHVSALSNK